jgi:alpha-ribazole phosphatase
MSRLVLVRHAEPEEDARGRCYGSLDIGLSARGREQAAALPRKLSGEPLEAVYVSPRIRTRETAAPLGVPVVEDARLCELDFGAFEGRTYDELAAAEPALYERWMTAPTTVRFPDGESYGDLRARATEALDEIRARHACAAVVSHGGVIRAALATWLELPDHAIFRLAQDYCGVTIVDWLGDEPLLRLLNG